MSLARVTVSAMGPSGAALADSVDQVTLEKYVDVMALRIMMRAFVQPPDSAVDALFQSLCSRLGISFEQVRTVTSEVEPRIPPSPKTQSFPRCTDLIENVGKIHGYRAARDLEALLTIIASACAGFRNDAAGDRCNQAVMHAIMYLGPRLGVSQRDLATGSNLMKSDFGSQR